MLFRGKKGKSMLHLCKYVPHIFRYLSITKYYLSLHSETFQINNTYVKMLLQTITYCALIIYHVTLFILK